MCCRLLVLYSLCHTEYWLGGRWLNGSCLALLMLYIFFYYFYSLIFLFAKCGHSGPLSALLHTSNPLTSADSVNCLHPLGTPAVSVTVFLSFPSSSCARGACFHNVTVLAVCAWEPQCVTLMKKVSVNASPAQFELSLSSSFVCLPASVKTHSLTICCHYSTSFHLQPQGSISVYCFHSKGLVIR